MGEQCYLLIMVAKISSSCTGTHVAQTVISSLLDVYHCSAIFWHKTMLIAAYLLPYFQNTSSLTPCSSLQMRSSVPICGTVALSVCYYFWCVTAWTWKCENVGIITSHTTLIKAIYAQRIHLGCWLSFYRQFIQLLFIATVAVAHSLSLQI